MVMYTMPALEQCSLSRRLSTTNRRNCRMCRGRTLKPFSAATCAAFSSVTASSASSAFTTSTLSVTRNSRRSFFISSICCTTVLGSTELTGTVSTRRLHFFQYRARFMMYGISTDRPPSSTSHHTSMLMPLGRTSGRLSMPQGITTPFPKSNVSRMTSTYSSTSSSVQDIQPRFHPSIRILGFRTPIPALMFAIWAPMRMLGAMNTAEKALMCWSM
mmetsp:Transcript_35964/g.90238  ORF Transcript_35964/g.90238 Transcript_35964/m.90238 type:complete len:216 (+) Transcript_35964:164-811(+)